MSFAWAVRPSCWASGSLWNWWADARFSAATVSYAGVLAFTSIIVCAAWVIHRPPAAL
ncbi:hypothetical protein ACIPW5_18425 [Streptomyces sp. NPDC090077]|uniref:hypothetical protein n=1 Tax=Streptomyces sp. NPDC090077 TaxID=3365938 RepID=UPI0037F26E53